MVWILNYQMQMLFTIILFPHVLLVAPFIFYMLFLVYYIFIQNFANKPISSTNKEKTSVFMYQFLSLTMVIFMVLTGIMF